MNIDNFIKRFEGDRLKRCLGLLSVVVMFVIVTTGCAPKQEEVVNDISQPAPVAKTEPSKTAEIEVEDDVKMVSYDVISIGRSDPFMPYDEYQAFLEAKSAAYAEAYAHNSKIDEIMRLKDTAITEPDDINPYSFDLPTPPTSLASSESHAAKITRTKVVGIMYNEKSPSAIINVDNKDYLVRQGDKIIGQEYIVDQINQSWISVSMGTNTYSASIGELFSLDELDGAQNDLYNLRNRFGGRKS
ncbi:MAG: hypothetical protein E7Z87_07520 [Cyanobacteria bacterium SIG26]|nr:hypothetical protein [Cyanobacteria bacterium SIG26]